MRHRCEPEMAHTGGTYRSDLRQKKERSCDEGFELDSEQMTVQRECRFDGAGFEGALTRKGRDVKRVGARRLYACPGRGDARWLDNLSGRA